jgi:hypothetical protein
VRIIVDLYDPDFQDFIEWAKLEKKNSWNLIVTDFGPEDYNSCLVYYCYPFEFNELAEKFGITCKDGLIQYPDRPDPGVKTKKMILDNLKTLL